MHPPRLRFGPFELDAAAAQLLRDGAPVHLPPRCFDLLRHLADRPGRLVTKDELLEQVWGRTFITEAVIKTAVSELRAVLDDDAREPRYIETVPRRGYRFVATTAPAATETAGEAPPTPPDPAAPASTAGAGVGASGACGAVTGLHDPARAASPPAAAAGTPRHPLPPPATPLIGRDDEQAMVADLVVTQRLVCLAGPGGVGKTRIALALAHALQDDFRDGTLWIELAALPANCDAATLRGAIAQALGLGPAAAASDSALARGSAPMRALVVLDNAEHVADALAPLIGTLLDAAPGLHLLVTSQEPLGLGREQVFRVGPLPVPAGPVQRVDALLAQDAARLFVERIAARLPGFAPTPQQLQPLAAICRALDGLPLALELAAACVPLLGLHGLAERLQAEPDAALALLTRGARDALPRHRSLRDALAWSHALLSAREQRVFRRLAVFADTFEPAAAEALCSLGADGAADVLDALQGLQAKSLLVVRAADPVHARLGLLAAPRAFAVAQLAASGEEPACRLRHAQIVLARLQRQAARWLDLPTFEWQREALPDLPDLRAAFAWAHSQGAAQQALLAGLAAWGCSLWLAAGAPHEAVRAIDAAVATGTGDPSGTPGATWPASTRLRVAQAQAQLGVAMVLPAERAMQAAENALALAQQLGDAPAAYWAMSYATSLVQWAPRPGFDVDDTIARMRALEQPDWPALRMRPRRIAQAMRHMLAGRWQACRDAFAAEQALCLHHGDLRTAWLAGTNTAHARLVLGEVDEALAVAGAVVADARRAGRLRQAWGALAMQGIAQVLAGQREAASATWRELHTLLRSEGALPWADDYWPALLVLENRLDDAARLLGRADALQARKPVPRGALPQKLRDHAAVALEAALPPARLAGLLEDGAGDSAPDLEALLAP